jgi:hypothetical protein
MPETWEYIQLARRKKGVGERVYDPIEQRRGLQIDCSHDSHHSILGKKYSSKILTHEGNKFGGTSLPLCLI